MEMFAVSVCSMSCAITILPTAVQQAFYAEYLRTGLKKAGSLGYAAAGSIGCASTPISENSSGVSQCNRMSSGTLPDTIPEGQVSHGKSCGKRYLRS